VVGLRAVTGFGRAAAQPSAGAPAEGPTRAPAEGPNPSAAADRRSTVPTTGRGTATRPRRS
jgi:hypothetical protein